LLCLWESDRGRMRQDEEHEGAREDEDEEDEEDEKDEEDEEGEV
jgi:hypothetical protein